jgi:circadian clock protein KaiC
MMLGGYHRGSNTLISGAPGTAKSTLCGLFAAAACARGERTVYVSFDEGADQVVRNLASVNVQLAPYRKSGLLEIYSTRTRGPNVEDQFSALRMKVRDHDPQCVIIDPLSALSTKLAHLVSADAAQQFLAHLKGKHITVVNTSLMDGVTTDEATATGISTIADTWIHLSYLVQDGERNRSLTIVKSRGTGHSNQVRELVLSNEGVTLADVVVAQGKALIGVATSAWEPEAQVSTERTQAGRKLKRLHLELSQAESKARLRVATTDMEARNAAVDILQLRRREQKNGRRGVH